MNKKQKKMLYRILITAAMVLVLNLIPIEGILQLTLYLAAYLVIGYDILRKAGKGILNRRMFDENFLMAVATIAAFVIGDLQRQSELCCSTVSESCSKILPWKKSRGQIMDAVDMRPEVVNLVVGSEVKEIPSQDARVKDIIMIRPGDRIPLDAKVIEGESRRYFTGHRRAGTGKSCSGRRTDFRLYQ